MLGLVPVVAKLLLLDVSTVFRRCTAYLAYLELIWRRLGVWVVLIVATIVVVVHVLSLFLGLMLGLLFVEEVFALGFGKTIDLGTGETGEHLFGQGMGDWLACCRFSAIVKIYVQTESFHEPSARWWSSKALKPMKAAPPPITSWLNEAWWSSL